MNLAMRGSTYATTHATTHASTRAIAHSTARTRRRVFRAWLAGVALAATCAAAETDNTRLLPFIWNDVTGSVDMPWVGKGGRAHWYKKITSSVFDVMNPRGATIESRWGASSGSGENPNDAADKAGEYLRQIGYLAPWPAYPGVQGEQGTPSYRGQSAFPYRLTIVAIQPTVVIMRFDLSAALEDPIEFSAGAFPPSHRNNYYEQYVTWAAFKNRVMFGTKVLDRGTMLWFSPDARVPPTPLDTAAGRDLVIEAGGMKLKLVKQGREWDVRR